MRINDNYRIEISKYNHTLEKLSEVEIKDNKSQTTGETKMVWNQIGFYSSVKSAIKAAMLDDVKVCEDVKGIIERIDLFEKSLD